MWCTHFSVKFMPLILFVCTSEFVQWKQSSDYWNICIKLLYLGDIICSISCYVDSFPGLSYTVNRVIALETICRRLVYNIYNGSLCVFGLLKRTDLNSGLEIEIFSYIIFQFNVNIIILGFPACRYKIRFRTIEYISTLSDEPI